MPRYCTYEHEENAYEVAAMTEAEFNAGGRVKIEGAGEYVWHEAPDAETALRQHVTKHDEWVADVMAGRPDKHTY